ncbi:hypothetical protein AMTRI_Chr02g262310 [Amborella trichopoda]
MWRLEREREENSIHHNSKCIQFRPICGDWRGKERKMATNNQNPLKKTMPLPHKAWLPLSFFSLTPNISQDLHPLKPHSEPPKRAQQAPIIKYYNFCVNSTNQVLSSTHCNHTKHYNF